MKKNGKRSKKEIAPINVKTKGKEGTQSIFIFKVYPIGIPMKNYSISHATFECSTD